MQNGAETKLFTYTTSDNSTLGQAVAISGNVALVGRYLYRWDGAATWTKDANLPRGNIFKPVALSGMRAVVGNNYSVNVYRFTDSDWVKEAKLVSSGKGNDGFGFSVSVNGDVAIVGAWGTDADSGRESAGAAYVYRFTGSSWREEAKLTAGDAAMGDQFGRAVAINGNVAIVGGPYDDAGLGSAYIFRYDGSSWRQDAKFSFNGTPPSAAYFGAVVAVEQNVALIG